MSKTESGTNYLVQGSGDKCAANVYFKRRNFRDFAIFGKIRESLFPRNIC